MVSVFSYYPQQQSEVIAQCGTISQGSLSSREHNIIQVQQVFWSSTLQSSISVVVFSRKWSHERARSWRPPSYLFPSSLSLSEHWRIVSRSRDCSAALNSSALITPILSALYSCYSLFCGASLHYRRRVSRFRFQMMHCFRNPEGSSPPSSSHPLFCIIRQKKQSVRLCLPSHLIRVQNLFNLTPACVFVHRSVFVFTFWYDRQNPTLSVTLRAPCWE